ncbi:unnamed protein product [Nesidiocoris tenuis]|uniref:Uncharacterized protein n=1 Tax=Nesidiocoris tenuis TaxID=355587 RepID=A0A6H5G5M3_9HEMI|nr:unnamed protein product [Nesidiocoris tenuis]
MLLAGHWRRGMNRLSDNPLNRSIARTDQPANAVVAERAALSQSETRSPQLDPPTDGSNRQDWIVESFKPAVTIQSWASMYLRKFSTSDCCSSIVRPLYKSHWEAPSRIFRVGAGQAGRTNILNRQYFKDCGNDYLV